MRILKAEEGGLIVGGGVVTAWVVVSFIEVTVELQPGIGGVGVRTGVRHREKALQKRAWSNASRSVNLRELVKATLCQICFRHVSPPRGDQALSQVMPRAYHADMAFGCSELLKKSERKEPLRFT